MSLDNRYNEQVAIWYALADSYSKKYGIRIRVFKRILRHMTDKLGEDATICFLCKIVGENHNKPK